MTDYDSDGSVNGGSPTPTPHRKEKKEFPVSCRSFASYWIDFVWLFSFFILILCSSSHFFIFYFLPSFAHAYFFSSFFCILLPFPSCFLLSFCPFCLLYVSSSLIVFIPSWLYFVSCLNVFLLFIFFFLSTLPFWLSIFLGYFLFCFLPNLSYLDFSLSYLLRSLY